MPAIARQALIGLGLLAGSLASQRSSPSAFHRSSDLSVQMQRRPTVGTDDRGPPGRPLVTRAAGSDLSTYTLEVPLNSQLLETCAREAVLHLDEAPCLHLVCQGAAESSRHPMPDAFPQVWNNMRAIVDRDSPDVLVFVHHLPHIPLHKTCWKLQEVTGRATQPAEAPSAAPQGCDSQEPALAPSLVAGKVGECCGKDDHGDPSALGTQGDHGRTAAETHRPLHEEVSFWGLVLQSQRHAGMDGCFLLKTVRSEDAAGCTCTYFSLTRVCWGLPLCEQYQQSWLV